MTDANFPKACKAFNSIFTRVEAAGGIVRNANREYLFIKRLGIWDLPKGKLHKKESAPDGALREVTEETGLSNLTLTRQLQSTYHIYTDRKGREVLKETFWFEMRCNEDQKLVPQLEEDITEVKWFGADELNIPVQNTYASLRQLLEAYLQA
jgi:8-oxo-dGTP pyrophosphatase MutT (NUDIX family)